MSGVTVLCRQCFERRSIPDMLVCARCADKNNPSDPIEEGKAVRRGEDLKALEEEAWDDEMWPEDIGQGTAAKQEVSGAELGRDQGGAP